MTKHINVPSIVQSRYPSYHADALEWEEWRLCYWGGKEFRHRYLEHFSTREDAADFARRKKLTPIPTFAKSAINDVRNSIFQRFSDIVRTGGSLAYQEAVAGLNRGIDNRGSTMNGFLGQKVLTELLIMGRVGIMVDMPEIVGPTLRDAAGKHPYLYVYPVEDILNWSCTKSEEPSEYQSILLRETNIEVDEDTLLAVCETVRFRKMWIDRVTGFVTVQFYDADGTPISRDGLPGGGPIVLEGLTRIPFVMPSIGDSLIKDVTTQQIALLNLGSSDVAYALQSNFPFYTEERDPRGVGHHLKPVANEDGTATAGGQGGTDETIKVGTTQGRYYDKGTQRPDFIAPPTEPLMGSMALQAKLEADIRKLINLAVLSLASRASAESKMMDNQGLEAGLSFIGLVLQAAERQIADYWAAYEEKVETRRTIALITYPERYSLKSNTERIEECDKLWDMSQKIPSRTLHIETGKLIVDTLYNGKRKVEILRKIEQELNASPVTTSDPDVVQMAREQRLATSATLSESLGFKPGEAEEAKKEHVELAGEIAKTQGVLAGSGGSDPAARGVSELSANPNAGKEEKAASRDTTLSADTKKPVRGEGK